VADDEAVRAWLRERGAESITHPGGTLYDHLSRVHDRLVALGLAQDLCLAGLTHATYGTDGFDVTLLGLDRRETLRALVGPAAEAQVYRYCAGDRKLTWRDLARTGELHDRFTGTVEPLEPDDLRAFADLSIVNELDLVERDPAIGERFGDYFRDVFGSWSPVASPEVMRDARSVLAFR
jgi:hypothetical protein